MSNRFLICAVLTGAILTAPLWAIAENVSPREINFDVFLDDREIGYHNYSVLRDQTGVRIDSRAQFRVRFLFIDAFRYDHVNSELWEDGCLRRISSSTNANGKAFAVNGAAAKEGFVIDTGSGSERLTDCVMSFAYWNPDFLQAERLLNSQTGEYLEIEVTPLDPGTVRIGDTPVSVEWYRVAARGVDLEIGYTEYGEWVALDSTVKGGRKLRYRRQADDLREVRRAAAGDASGGATAWP